ncbi:uncharacterized protein LOC131930648 [Physella acuta]|uniref:uncharacterized protein LOC131930648 n=1 Tax=Physella acuta TaxID=109671 RepID=UPI0027DAC863|nr:uncharacterized protein LOC131930648 [Physella acuta]
MAQIETKQVAAGILTTSRKMGAAQSKKRRKERKRKKRVQMGLPNFDVPRSASADVIRTLSLSSSSCFHCQHPSGRRTFSGSLENSTNFGCERCLQSAYDDLRFPGDGYDSCPSYSTSNCCLGPAHAGTEMERSTMSLNRNLTGNASRIVQSRSPEMDEIIDILKHHENRKRELSSLLTSPPSLESSTEQAASTTSHGLTSAPSIKVKNSLAVKSESKKPITILEDEESRLARWQKQKEMAQQLRTLRKHIQLQEAESKHVVPFPVCMSPLENETVSNTSVQPPVNPIEQHNSSDLNPSNTLENTRRSLRSKFSKMRNYRYLDNHPVLSKLQNEQNNRLESMERRIKEIRISAMQEAERRKFAEIFPAKEDNSESERMLREAKEMLEELKREKKKKQIQEEQKSKVQLHGPCTSGSRTESNQDLNNDSVPVDDSGEIIPVHILSSPRRNTVNRVMSLFPQQKVVKSDITVAKPGEQNKKADWLTNAWPNINLSHPLTWVLLPFLMFPLILRLILSVFISGSSTTGNTNTGTSNTGQAKPKK